MPKTRALTIYSKAMKQQHVKTNEWENNVHGKKTFFPVFFLLAQTFQSLYFFTIEIQQENNIVFTRHEYKQQQDMKYS